MAREYHYLAAALEAPRLDPPRKDMSVSDLFRFCMEELDPGDAEQLHRLFFFNDIRNAVFFHFNKKTRREDYSRPAFYEEHEFMALLSKPAGFLPFMARFYEARQAGTRLYPDLPDTDELTALFYEDLDELVPPGFGRAWYLFELELRNFANARMFRRLGADPRPKLIPFGQVYDRIGSDDSPDFGLGSAFAWTGALLEAEPAGHRQMELAIERARWDWLAETVAGDWSSAKAIYSIVIQTQSAERWERVSPEGGEAAFKELHEAIQRSVRFSIEFNQTGAVHP